jgi:hypothetical protein
MIIENRNLLEDKKKVDLAIPGSWGHVHFIHESVTIASHAIDRAIAAEKQLESLQNEKTALSAFAKQIIYAAWEGGQYDGAEIQDLGVKHGLLIKEGYDPDVHGSDLGFDFAPGDIIYVYSPILQIVQEGKFCIACSKMIPPGDQDIHRYGGCSPELRMDQHEPR